MTLDEFWATIASTRHSDVDAHLAALETHLAALPPDEIVDFDYWWKVLLREADHWALSGAFYLLTGRHSDDGFLYFRDWLILRGRDAFSAAVSDPDTLADLTDPSGHYSGENSVAINAWFAVTGLDPDDGYDAFYAAQEVRHPSPAAPDLRVDRSGWWDSENEAEARLRLPRLAARFFKPPEASA